MSHESQDVKLARIEEGLIRIHGEIKSLKSDLKPITDNIKILDRDLTILKRDRFWLFTITGFSCSTIVSTAAYALVEHLKK